MKDKTTKFEETSISTIENKFGHKIIVLMRVDYPSYSFIFGVPEKNNPKYDKEAGFIQYKDKRKDHKGFAVFLDVTEIDEFIKGLEQIKSFGKIYSKLWKKK